VPSGRRERRRRAGLDQLLAAPATKPLPVAGYDRFVRSAATPGEQVEIAQVDELASAATG
jgi:hypothetical protein